MTLVNPVNLVTADNEIIIRDGNSFVGIPLATTTGMPLLSTGDSSAPAFGILPVLGGGTGLTSFTPEAVPFTQATSSDPLTFITLSDEHFFIGTATDVLPATIQWVDGANTTVSFDPPTCTISIPSPWFDYTNVTTSTYQLQSGYIHGANCTGDPVVFSLPTGATLGQTFAIVGVQEGWSITQRNGERMKVGSATSALGVGGSINSTAPSDSVQFICVGTNPFVVWEAQSYHTIINVVT